MKEAKKEVPKTVIYVGPNIGTVLRRFCVFKNGLPDTLTPLLQERPALTGLFVDVEQLPNAVRDLNDPNSTISTLYKHITN